jgi:hypothetical protein
MAEKAGTGRGLNLRAKLDVAQAIKDARALKNEIKGIYGVTTGPNKGFDVKPLSEYQAGLLKIKQEALDLAKQNATQSAERRSTLDAERKAKQEQAAAEKSASLATQAALKEEARLRREQITLAKQSAAETNNKKRPTQISNSQAEIDAYKKAQQGSILYTSAINNEVVARAKLNAEAARTAIANGTLNTGTTQYTIATQQQTAATNKNVLSKQQLAQMLAEEKYRQQQSTAELKNNAREMLNAKGSLEQRRAALIRLTTVYDRLNKAERESAAGKRLESIIKGLVGQIGTLEQATGRAQRGVGGYAEGISAFFKSIGQNILSGLGPLALLTTAIAAAKEAFSHNVDISDNFVDVQRTAKLSGEEVDRLSDKLKKINTRTSLEGLLDIGFEGGRLGVQKDELVDFITTVDKLAVVLKKELPGGAEAVAESEGKIVKIYKIAENEGISLAAAMDKVASSQLELAHSGGVTVKYLQDFTLGVAGSAVSAKLSLPVIEAYGAVMSNAGTIASSASISLTRIVNDLSVKRGKYYAIAQLADSSLTIEKFNNLINTDTQAALSLFFRGLKAGNPTQIEFAERIRSVGITTGKVSNAVKVLANNFDLLQGKLGIGTKGYEESISVSHNFELANNSLAASFDKIKNSIVNYFTDPTSGRALASLLNSFTDTRVESEKLAEEYIDNKHQLDEMEKSLKPLTDRYDELQAKVKQVGGVSQLTKADQDELREVTARIGSILPGVTTQFDKFGNSIAISRDRIRELTKAQRELLVAQNREGIAQANKDFDESQRKAAAQLKIVQDLASKVGQQYGRKEVTNNTVRDANDYAKILVGQSYAAAKAAEELGSTLTVAQKKVINYYEAIDKAKTKPKQKLEVMGTGELADEAEIPRTTELIKGEIKALQDADKKLAVTSDEFKSNIIKIKALRKELRIALGGKDTEGIKTANEYQSAVKSRNDLQSKILELTKRGTDKQLSADAQELESVKNKYAKMREEAEKFNNNPKNKAKGLRVNAGGLAVAQDREETALRDKQDAEKLKATLDKQKQLYADYEEYKSKVGKEEADKRYATLVEKDETYLDALKTKKAELEDPQKSKGANESDLAAVALQLKLTNEEIAAAELANAKLKDDLYTEAYSSAMTNAQKMLAIEVDYNVKRKALGKEATTEQLANLQLERDEKIRTQNEANAVSKSGYATLMMNFDAMTRGAVLKRLNEIKAGYAEEYRAGKLTGEQLAKLTADINSHIASLNGNNVFNKITESIKKYKEALATLPKDSIGVKNAQKEMYGSIGEGAEAAAVGLSGIKDIFADLGVGGEKTQVVLGQVAGVLEGFGGIAKGLKDGDPVAIVAGSIKLLSSAIDIFNGKDRKLNRKIEAYKLQLDSLGKAYRKLERDVNNSVGESYYSDSAKQIENLKAQQAELIKMRDAERSKKKADQTKIAEYQAQIDEIPGQIADINKAISETLIQTNFKDLSNSLADAFADAFGSAEDSAKSFDEVFDKVIVNAVKNSLKLKILDPIVKKFTDDLTAYAQGNDNSVIGFDFEKYRALLKAGGDLVTAGFQKIKDYFPDIETDTSSTDTKSGISGVITSAGLTEDTANRAMGLWQGQYDQTKKIALSSGDIYRISVDNLTYVKQIAANTKRGADNTDIIPDMAADIKLLAQSVDISGGTSLSQALRNSGIK